MRIALVLLTVGFAWCAEAPALQFAVERVIQAQELRPSATDGAQELGLLVLVLRARNPSGVTVLGYGVPTVDEARSDAGEDCSPTPTGEEPGGGFRLLRRGEAAVEEPPLVLRLTPPPRPRFRLARCTGSVEVRWREGPLQTRALSGDAPTGAIIELPQVVSGTASVVEHLGDDLRLGWPEPVDQRLRGISFEAADGAAIVPRRRGVINQEGHVVRTFTVSLPAGSRIVIELHPPEQKARIPFAVENVALPGVGG